MPTFSYANSYSGKGVGWTGPFSLLSTPNALNVGDLVILVLGYSSTVASPTSVTDDGGNTYTLATSSSLIFTGYQARIYYSVLTNSFPANGFIILNGSQSASLINSAAYFFTVDSGTSFSTSSVLTSIGASATTTTPSITTASLATSTVLVSGVFINGPNGDTWTEDNDTLNGTWSSGKAITGPSITNGHTGGNATSNYSERLQYKITTGSGTQTFNPTLGTSRLEAPFYFSIAQTGTPTGFTPNNPMGMMGFFGT